MHIQPQARRSVRALMGAAALGSTVGLAIGGVYLAGGMARATVVHAQIQRLAGAASGGFSDTALKAAAADSDPTAMAIARRYDQSDTVEVDLHDRQVATLVARLDARRQNRGDAPALKDLPPQAAQPVVLKASFVKPLSSHGAEPFHLRGALDESRDLECLTQAVYYESRGESPAGQAAVAQVILNRVRHPAFPKTVCGVVFQGSRAGGCQFSFACNGESHARLDNAAWRRSEKVAARALDGQVMTEVGDATHFHVAGVSAGWGARLLKVAQIGAHVFYRFAGHKGAPSMFHDEPAVSGPAQSHPIFASLALTSGDNAGRLIVSAVKSVVAPPANAATPAPPSPKPQASSQPASPAIDEASVKAAAPKADAPLKTPSSPT